MSKYGVICRSYLDTFHVVYALSCFLQFLRCSFLKKLNYLQFIDGNDDAYDDDDYGGDSDYEFYCLVFNLHKVEEIHEIGVGVTYTTS